MFGGNARMLYLCSAVREWHKKKWSETTIHIRIGFSATTQISFVSDFICKVDMFIIRGIKVP